MARDADRYKKLVTHVIAKLRELDAELMACRLLLSVLQLGHPDLHPEQSLDAIKDSAQVQKPIREKYAHLEELVGRFFEAAADEELSQWFEKWKPSGPLN